MSKNKKWITYIFLFAVVLIGLFFAWNTYIYKPYSSNYNAEKTATSSNSDSSDTTDSIQTENDNSINISNENGIQQNVSTPSENKTQPNTESQTPSAPITQSTPSPTYTEVNLSSFSTKIYSKDSARQNNINITTSRLNNVTVKNGATFSFCNTLGPSSTSNGYQKADIFDSNGKKKKGLGGGNCQVSTTLYNAVLSAPGLSVTERHQHSNSVPYIQKGKDAAVAYGSYDLKFVNSTGSDVVIKASSNNSNVNISLVKLVKQ